MDTIALFKKLAAEQPALLEGLVPSEGCNGYIRYRGVTYIGQFEQVGQHDGKWYGILKPGYRTPCKLFEGGKLPVGAAQGSRISFDAVEGMFGATLDDILPCTGDLAYTSYHGQEWIGVMRMSGEHTHLHIGFVEPEDPQQNWRWHSPEYTRGLQIGYDGVTVWDAQRQMYHTHADHD